MKVNALKIKNIVKLEIIVMMQPNIEVIHICNLKYKTPKEICTIFHNEYKYDFHFIIRDLAKNLKESLLVLEKILKMYIIFFIPIEK